MNNLYMKKDYTRLPAGLHPFHVPCLRAGGRVSVLGVTGSIGTSALDVLESAGGAERFEFIAFTGARNAELMIDLAKKYRPQYVAMADESAAKIVKDALISEKITVLSGDEGVCEAASVAADWVCAAIVGAAGLRPVLRAARNGCVIALANKECLVTAGAGFMTLVAESGSTIFPVDSEHNALYQLLSGMKDTDPTAIETYYLTASGGPFLRTPLEDFTKITPAEAVKHPNWSMGAKISVDSATMMNKALEIVEACRLFGIKPDQCDAIIHPQSFAHGLLRMKDGGIFMYLSPPDMRAPIQSALLWPEVGADFSDNKQPFSLLTLQFEAPDPVRFPAIGMAKEAMKRGEAATSAFNAANEICVEAFLQKRLPFDRISYTAYEVMHEVADSFPDEIFAGSLAAINRNLEADQCARASAKQKIGYPVQKT